MPPSVAPLAETPTPRIHAYRETIHSVCTNLALGALLLLAACIFAPTVHDWSVALGLVRQEEFARVFRRLLMLIGAGWILLRFRPWRDGSLKSYGLTLSGLSSSHFIIGFSFGAVLTLIPIAWQLTHGALTWEHLNAAKILSRLGKSVMSATIASLLEEWFFRGWLERKLNRNFSRWTSIAAVSTVAAVVHVFRPNILGSAVVEPSFAAAVQVFGHWLTLLGDPSRFGTTFIGLFLFSTLLSVVNLRTNSVARSTGLHFAAILLSYSYHAFTDRVFSTAWTGGAVLTEAPITWLIIVTAIVIIGRRRAAGEIEQQAFATPKRFAS